MDEKPHISIQQPQKNKLNAESRYSSNKVNIAEDEENWCQSYWWIPVSIVAALVIAGILLYGLGVIGPANLNGSIQVGAGSYSSLNKEKEVINPKETTLPKVESKGITGTTTTSSNGVSNPTNTLSTSGTSTSLNTASTSNGSIGTTSPSSLNPIPTKILNTTSIK